MSWITWSLNTICRTPIASWSKSQVSRIGYISQSLRAGLSHCFSVSKKESIIVSKSRSFTQFSTSDIKQRKCTFLPHSYQGLLATGAPICQLVSSQAIWPFCSRCKCLWYTSEIERVFESILDWVCLQNLKTDFVTLKLKPPIEYEPMPRYLRLQRNPVH